MIIHPIGVQWTEADILASAKRVAETGMTWDPPVLIIHLMKLQRAEKNVVEHVMHDLMDMTGGHQAGMILN